MRASIQQLGARGSEKRARRTQTAPPVQQKTLPSVVKEIQVESDYAIVKFRREGEAYKGYGQPVWFKAVNYGALPAQVQVHLGLRGLDEKARRERMIDVDLYLSVEEFRKVLRLLRRVEFKVDRVGVVRAKQRRR